MNPTARRLEAALDITRRAAIRLESSLTNDADDLARAIASEEDCLDLHQLRVLDSFVQRFQQTHEHLTRRLFPALYRLEEAGSRAPPLAQLLDWLEGLGIIPHALQWIEMAETRNRLVHEYPLTATERRTELTSAVKQSGTMLDTLERVGNLLATRRKPEDDHG